MFKRERKIKPRWTLTLLLALFFISTNAEAALQTKLIANNQTVKAYVAANNKTRLFVSGERISALRGTPDAYTYVNDDRNGQVFITPTPPFKTKSFSLFVTTEQGKTYGLILTPHSALSDSIMLLPNNPINQLPIPTADDNEQMIHLLRAMISNTPQPGYTQVKINNAVGKSVLNHRVRMQLLSVYQGESWQGEIYRVTNLSNRQLKIDEKQFFEPTMRAIVLSTHALIPQGSALMYVVKRGAMRS